MAPRTETKTITKKVNVNPEEPAPEQFTQRKRPDVGQFRLQVDRQVVVVVQEMSRYYSLFAFE